MNKFIKHRHIILLLLLLQLVMVSRAQQNIHAYLETDSIVIGQQVYLVWEVKTVPGNRIQSWPALPDTLSSLEIIGSGKIDTLRQKDSFTYRQRLLITSFEAGKINIAPLRAISNNDGKTDTLTSNALTLHVATVAVDTTQPFKPIKDIAEVEPSSAYTQFIENLKNHWQLYLGILLLAALIVFVIIYFVRNKKAKVPEHKLPPERPHEKARRLLNELAGAKLWEQGRVKEYYSSLSDIIRTYLEERYEVAAMEQTTDELLVLARTNREIKKVRQELKKILRTADLAKFAKANPLPEEHIACMEAAYEIVQRTRQKEEVNHDQ